VLGAVDGAVLGAVEGATEGAVLGAVEPPPAPASGVFFDPPAAVAALAAMITSTTAPTAVSTLCRPNQLPFVVGSGTGRGDGGG
jgi:hypothetical protein